jgi:hypothetical protein
MFNPMDCENSGIVPPSEGLVRRLNPRGAVLSSTGWIRAGPRALRLFKRSDRTQFTGVDTT